jgi:hypothetical protein
VVGIWEPENLPSPRASGSLRISAFQIPAAPRVGPGGRDARSLGGLAPGPPARPEWPRGARSRGGHGGPHGARPRVPRGRREVTSQSSRNIVPMPILEAHAGGSMYATTMARLQVSPLLATSRE